MSLPSAYTRSTLAAYMVTGVLQGTASALEWSSTSGPILEAVNEVEFEVGPVVDATDLRALRALARREAWRAAVAGTADRFRVSSDGQTVDLQQVHEHAVAMLGRAEADYAAALAGDGYTVGVTAVRASDDPYAAPLSSAEW